MAFGVVARAAEKAGRSDRAAIGQDLEVDKAGGTVDDSGSTRDKLEVTPRSIYRGIAALQASRVPIEGASGLGYVLRRGFDLPPLMFTAEAAAIAVLLHIRSIYDLEFEPLKPAGSIAAAPRRRGHSTVTLLARLRGWSTSVPLSTAM